MPVFINFYQLKSLYITVLIIEHHLMQYKKKSVHIFIKAEFSAYIAHQWKY